MSNEVEQQITRLYRVRRTVLQMLFDRGYNVTKADHDLGMTREMFEHKFRSTMSTVQDVHGQRQVFNRDAFNMLKEKRDDAKDQIWVFFHKELKAGTKDLRLYSERMEKDGVSRAILIVIQNLTPSARKDLVEIQARQRIEVFLENELQVNITEHVLVPKHEVLSDEEKRALLRRYKLKPSQLPRILANDPVARYYGLRSGQVVKITRPSETAGRYVSYRLAVGA